MAAVFQGGGRIYGEALSLSEISPASMFTCILHRYVEPVSANPAKLRPQVHVVMALVFCVRDSGVCGGGLVPALYPSSQPHQPGGDQRQAGVRGEQGAG